ncbi:four helix bundle protein [Tenacibaculum aquimarinum]|uniref:four helix bundle protein n=1 Tax=Tenacibaculum aquimarinum TaxID=2910675 RepID=UPI001F0A3400|nr:four helix bundle protein [Tenacibaculum aquimarinum]MCH3884933.1 four helix bundle protein [Tenacibaculum aquimarinum]
MKVYSFEKLMVWQESKNLVKDIYRLTKSFPSEERFGLISQLRRASVSIASNLAEGTSRKTNKDKAHFTTISFSSAMEVLNQLIISKELNFLSEKDYILVREKLEKITNMLNALRNSQLK